MARPKAAADVRMFPGWAHSVLWLDGPIGYDELGLPAELATELDRWDLAWSRANHPSADPDLPFDEAAHAVEGRRLARRVADALGDELVLTLELDEHELFRGRGPARVPVAAAHVHARQAAINAERARIAALIAEGGTFEWRAYPPP